MLSFPLAPLCGPSQFQNVFSQPDARQHAKGVLLLAKRNSIGQHRIGLITPKKKLRRAVDRNRFRRVARAVLRTSQLDSSIDLVVMVKQPIANLHASEISHALARALSQLHGKLPES